MSSSYIPSLDGIRAVSISIVFVAHIGFGHIIPGGFGVTIFFFLSGYLITTLLTREWDRFGAISLTAFYLRRVLRLGPPILITLAVGALLVSLSLVDGEIDPKTLLSQIFFYYNYYALYAENPGNVDGLGILWSLAVEEHFYLIWPALFILIGAQKLGFRGLVAMLVIILLWRIVRFSWIGSDANTIYLSTDTRFDSLLYGCLLALMTWKGQSERLFPPLKSGLWIILLALAALAVTFLYRDAFFRSTVRYSVQGIALIPLFYYAIRYHDAPIFRPLNWGFVRKIGHWSYTIYLIHFVIIQGLEYNGIAAFRTPQMALLAGGLSMAFAAAVYSFVEKPLHPMRRRLVGHAAAR